MPELSAPTPQDPEDSSRELKGFDPREYEAEKGRLQELPARQRLFLEVTQLLEDDIIVGVGEKYTGVFAELNGMTSHEISEFLKDHNDRLLFDPSRWRMGNIRIEGRVAVALPISLSAVDADKILFTKVFLPSDNSRAGKFLVFETMLFKNGKQIAPDTDDEIGVSRYLLVLNPEMTPAILNGSMKQDALQDDQLYIGELLSLYPSYDLSDQDSHEVLTALQKSLKV